MYRVLGLDIGESTVKAVQVTADLKGKLRITAFASLDVQSSGGVAEALNPLLKDDRFMSDFCITSLPADRFSFRNIRMPFREKREIEQTINFELEPLIPFSLDEILTDFIVVDQSDETDVLAAVLPKTVIRERLALLDQIPASVLEVESVPVALSLISAGYAEGYFIVLDVGARRTVAVFFRNGKIFQIRSFHFGGGDITGAVSKALHVDDETAEREKIKGEVEMVSREIARACNIFFANLDNTFKALKSRCPDERPSKIFVTGGGALCQLITDGLARYFSLPVEKVDVREMHHMPFYQETADNWDPMLMNHALALAVRGTKKVNGFNFRRGEFEARGQGRQFLAKHIRQATVTLFILLGILGVDFSAGYFIDRQYLANMKKEIAVILKANAPDVTKITDPVGQLKTRIGEARKFAVSGAGMDVTTLDFLKSVSEMVPETSRFLITDFTCDGEKIEIRGETSDYDSVDAIKKNIAGSRYFRNVTVSSANLVKDKNKVEFNLRMDCAG